ncbi:MAG: sugar phosphate isomerase/epimerase [Candidatus Aminicenantes bacterium]|nr:sugar phosphate isomerase/epimerase [Candidatus Aminicenantes bacterium]
MDSRQDSGDGRPGRILKVGLDGYGLKPLGLPPLRLLEWAAARGADGIQFSEPPPEADDPGFLKDLGQTARGLGLYLEWGGGQHIPFDPKSRRPIDIAAVNRKAAGQAAALGLTAIRSCSGGLMRWAADDPPVADYLQAMTAALRDQAPMLRGFGVTLALETHFEFTTFEILRHFEMCGAEPGGWLGICLDTMNVLTLLEDPVAAALRARPWIVMTHLKDGGILETAEGFRTFTAAVGDGIVDFASIIAGLNELERDIPLSVEDHGGDFLIPLADPAFRAKLPDLSVDEEASLRRLSRLTRERMETEGLAVLDRADWPRACEARMTRGLAAARRLAEGA